jgi:hypothetical protein
MVGVRAIDKLRYLASLNKVPYALGQPTIHYEQTPRLGIPTLVYLVY